MFTPTTVIFLLVTTVNIVTSQSYRAGVVVYRPVSDPTFTPSEFIMNNALKYVELINQNKNQVDILIFPEKGLTTTAIETPEKSLNAYSTKLGNIKDVACNNTKSEKNMDSISCAAKENKKYVIFNVLEKEDTNFYITTVGLDPTGAICLKCRKNHEVIGQISNSTDQKQCRFTAAFENNVSVKFTVLFGSDIAYPIPTDIKGDNVIMTSSIKNVLPLNIGFSLYQAFAISNGVNLLVSGYYEKGSNYGGSGVFLANGTSTISFKPDGRETDFANATVLIKEIPIKPQSASTVQTKTDLIGPLLNVTLEYVNFAGLIDKNKSVEHCIDSKCCSFKAELDGNTLSSYKWVVYSNKTKVVDQEIETFLCALVIESPTAAANTTFKSISVTAKFDRSKSEITLPLAVGQNISNVEFSFNKESNTITLNKEGAPLVFGTLHTWDAKNADGGSGLGAGYIILIVLVFLILIGGGVWFWRKRQSKSRHAAL